MERAIKAEIKRLCSRMRARNIASAKTKEKYQEKFETRTGIAGGVPAVAPHVFVHRHFDPAYCARNANFLAKTIWHKIRNRTYRPIPALNFQIPKPAGGYRSIMAFSIPDAAIANVMLWRTRTRNLKRLSPFSYAYHPERNVFDAIIALSTFVTDQKLFAVQIDFEKYFDSIPTSYLKSCIDDERLVSLTPDERFTFKEFLYHQYASRSDYAIHDYSRRVKGTPQGSSISLLLANLANQQLDRALERSSGKFVRYADDVVALCNNYEDAQDLQNAFTLHCRESGLKINEKKSPGIAIISDVNSEIRTFTHFDYLGYSITKSGMSIPDHVKSRIKTKLSRLIQLYLIQYPLKHGFNNHRCSRSKKFDWDLLGLISEIRGYLYGGLAEEEIRNFLKHGSKLRVMRGLMGFYPLLDQKKDLQELDGWLVNNLRRAMQKRYQMLWARYRRRGILPDNEELIMGTWLNLRAWRGSHAPPELRLPSFVRGWRAARKYYFTFGLEDVAPPQYGYY